MFQRRVSDEEAYDTPSSPMDESSSSTSGKVKHARRIPRPMNSFMVFAKIRRKILQERFPNFDNKEVSRMLGEEWAKLTEDEKQYYVEEAKRLAEQHKLDFPDWKFTRSTARGKKRRPSGGPASPIPSERGSIGSNPRSSLGGGTGSPGALRHPMKLELDAPRPIRTNIMAVPYNMTPPPAFPFYNNCDNSPVMDEPLPPYRQPPSHAQIDTVHV